MRKSPYHRFALVGNPFRETGEKELMHVHRHVDETLEDFFYATIERSENNLLKIIGETGYGKTDNLLIMHNNARKEKAFCRYINCDPDASVTIREILAALSMKKIFKPKYLKKINNVRKKLNKGNMDTETMVDAISAALNAYSPCFLLLDDFDRMLASQIGNDFCIVIQKVLTSTSGGVLIVTTTESDICELHGETITLEGFGDRDAELFVAKRLLKERSIEENIDPLFPFTPEAVHKMNAHTNGNPGELLDIMAKIVDEAVKREVMLIDNEFVSTILRRLQQ